MSKNTKPLLHRGDIVRFFNSDILVGKVVETRVAHLVRVKETGQSHWYADTNLERYNPQVSPTVDDLPDEEFTD